MNWVSKILVTTGMNQSALSANTVRACQLTDLAKNPFHLISTFIENCQHWESY